jgi:hypothetical protein
VCALYRIPHSAFLGWSDDDRNKAIWQHIRERQRCPNCRTRAEEWDERRGGHRHAYIPVEARCRGCELKQGKEASMAGEDLGRGVYVELKSREAIRGRS